VSSEQVEEEDEKTINNEQIAISKQEEEDERAESYSIWRLPRRGRRERF
jgi:hypothetical protein